MHVVEAVRGLEARVPELAGRDVFVVSWTTTPWTLPANLAVALNPGEEYLLLQVETGLGAERLLLAEGLAEQALKRAMDHLTQVGSHQRVVVVIELINKP